ncbi:MAG: hypothetical protein V3V00_16660 [Saprospiraceae bacterium]
MDRTSFLLFIFLFLFGSVFSQKNRINKDILEHKDGSVYIGTIIEESDWLVLFWSEVTDTIEVNKLHLARITRDASSYNAKNAKPTLNTRKLVTFKERSHKKAGYFVTFDIGVVTGQEVHWHSNLTLGKRVSPRFSVGVQGGKENTKVINNFDWRTDGFWVIGAYGRYYLLDTNIRPYVSGRIGYGFLNSDFFRNKKGGLGFVPSIGIHFSSRNNFRILVSVHQSIQKSSGSSTFNIDNFGNSLSYSYDTWLNRTVFKVGIEF